jgi:hypothetical protein
LGDIVAHPTFILLLLLLPRIEAPTGRDTPPIYVGVYSCWVFAAVFPVCVMSSSQNRSPVLL